MKKRILKYFLYISLSTLLLLVIVAGITQTPFFKDRLRVVVIQALSSQIRGSLQIGTIRGNFLTGLSIDSLMIYQGEEKILKTGQITIKHDPFSLLKKKISISRLSIVNPEVYIHRSLTGEWNYSALFAPSEDSAKSTFNWIIDVKDLSITGGAISVIDSFTIAQPGYKQMAASYVDYQKYSIHGINVKLGASYAYNSLVLSIKSARGSALLPGYYPLSLRADFSMNRKGIAVQNLKFTTAKSDVELNGRIKNANMFKGITSAELQNDSTTIQLLAKKIDFDELESFFPGGRTLKGSMFAQLDAVGTFGNLNITRLRIQSPRSLVNVSGTIKNLQHTDDLFINAVMGESKIDGREIAALIPENDVLDMEETGLINTSVQYTGTLRDFTAAVSLQGKIGEIEAKGHVILTDTIPKYDLSFSTRHLDLKKVIKSEIPMIFSVKGTFKGEGTRAENLASALMLDIDTVQFRRAMFTRSQVTITAIPYHLDGTAILYDGAASALVKASADLTNDRLPGFNADITLNSFDCSRVIADSAFRTSLSLKATLASEGKTVDDLSGKLTLDTYDAIIKGIDLSNRHLECSLSQKEHSNRSLTLASDFADVSLNGKFDLDIVYAYLTEQIPHLVNRLAKHASEDTTQPLNRQALSTIQKHAKEGQDIDFGYSFDLRNITPVMSLISTTPMQIQGSFFGRVKGNADVLSLTGNDTVSNVVVGEGDSVIFFRNTALSFNIENITRHQTLPSISGSTRLSIDTASIHFPLLTDIKFSTAFGKSQGTFSLAAQIESTYAFALQGKALIQPRAYNFALDTLRISNNSYTLQNAGPIEAIIDPSGYRLNHAVIHHYEDSLSLAGMIKNDGTFDARASLHNFPLEELNTFIHSTKSKQKDLGFRGKASANVHLTGTARAPVFNFKGTSDSTYYRSTKLGLVNAIIDYKEALAKLNVSAWATAHDSLPDLEVFGTLPINLGFSGVEKRFPDAEQNLYIKSDKFELGLLQTIFPDLENLAGTAVADLHVTGTPQDPDYAGTLSIKTARFTFRPNNIAYIMSGNMKPRGGEITLENYTLKNVPEEKKGGTMKVGGKLIIKDFDLASFDLTGKGDLLVMSDATRRKLTTFYGSIFIETDTGGVHFSGTQDRPNLRGKLNIREANIVFPPKTGVAASSSSETLPYIIVDDTSKHVRLAETGKVSSSTQRDSANQTRLEKAQTTDKETFLSKLRYDVVLQTQGKTSITMIFTPATNEELYAELDGKVNVVNDQGTANVFGDISIGSQSYYNFIKRFAASGSLQYVGPWDNPQMNILATYEGYKQNDTSKTGKQEKVIVELTITGTRYVPKLVMGMKVQTDPNTDPIDWSSQTKGGDVQSDAFSFMLTGKFRDELTASDNAAISNVGSTASSSLVNGITSSLLSGVFTNFLQKEFPFIQSASLSYEEGTPDLRISGEVAKGNLRFGGKMLNNIGNANVTYQLSLGEIFNSRSIRNLFIQLDHRVEGSYIDESNKNSTTTNTARIYYRISF
jgi:hypothetical protein